MEMRFSDFSWKMTNFHFFDPKKGPQTPKNDFFKKSKKPFLSLA